MKECRKRFRKKALKESREELSKSEGIWREIFKGKIEKEISESVKDVKKEFLTESRKEAWKNPENSV